MEHFIRADYLEAVSYFAGKDSGREEVRGVIVELYEGGEIGYIATQGQVLGSINARRDLTPIASARYYPDQIKTSLALAKALQSPMLKTVFSSSDSDGLVDWRRVVGHWHEGEKAALQSIVLSSILIARFEKAEKKLSGKGRDWGHLHFAFGADSNSAVAVTMPRAPEFFGLIMPGRE